MDNKADQPVYWRDKPVRDISDAIGRSLHRNSKMKVSPMSMALFTARKQHTREPQS